MVDDVVPHVQVVDHLLSCSAHLNSEGRDTPSWRASPGMKRDVKPTTPVPHLVEHDAVEGRDIGVLERPHQEIQLVPLLLHELFMPVVLEDCRPGRRRPRVGPSLVRDTVDHGHEAVQS